MYVERPSKPLSRSCAGRPTPDGKENQAENRLLGQRSVRHARAGGFRGGALIAYDSAEGLCIDCWDSCMSADNLSRIAHPTPRCR